MPKKTAAGPVCPDNQVFMVNVREASRLTGAAQWAIRRAIWDKKLRAATVGRRLLIDISDLKNYIDTLKQGGAK